MAVHVEDSKIFSKFMPSLAHVALLNVSTRFFRDFIYDTETLERVHEDIQQRVSASLNDHRAKRAEEKLLIIPAHLRHAVVKTVLGLRLTFDRWAKDHGYRIITEKRPTPAVNTRDNTRIHTGLDGTANFTKTAKLIVQNQTVNVRLRFCVACIHCLEESVLSLWREMEASGETYFEAGNYVMLDFWVRWIQEGSLIPWLQAIKENLTFPVEYLYEDPELIEDRFLFSPFFNLLTPQERETFLPYLTRTTWDDLRISLRYATKDEEVKILENDVRRVLLLYLNWPLQSSFLEVAKKVWHFLDIDSFYDVLMSIWKFQEEKRDFDYRQLFVHFWNSSPINLKETLKEYPTMNRKINAILNKIKRKRQSISGANQNKWLRRGGRLERAVLTSNVV